MHFAEARDGVKLAYQIVDYTDPWKKAPTILLQHGFGRNARFWYKWVPMLSRHFVVLMPDMRGFGASREGFSLSGNFDLPTFSSDLDSLLDAAGIDSVHYVGEAFGGTLGMQFAAEFPKRIRTLTLLSAPVFLHQKVKDIFALSEGSWADAIRARGVKAWAEGTNTVSRFPTWMGQGFLDWYSRELGNTDTETLAKFTEICSAYDQSPFLSRIKAPTLGVYSRSREEQVDLLRKHVADVTVLHIDTEYYLLYQIFPRACADAVMHFAAEHEGIVLGD